MSTLPEPAESAECGGSAWCLVLVTTASAEEADRLARALLEQRLAACVQVQPIQSYYRWQGELQCEPEQRLLIKTSTARYAALESFVLAHHSYQTPQIVQCPISAASAAHLTWMEDSLNS